MRIFIVGAGRLGTAFGVALSELGYEIVGAVSRSKRGADRARNLLKGASVTLWENLRAIPPADLIFVTVPDDAIVNVASKLSKLMAGTRSGVNSKRELPRVALHASGALSSRVLAPLRTVGLSVGSMHPLISVSEPVASSLAFRDAFFCVEGDRAAVRAVRRLLRELNARSFYISAEKKALYHAAAVLTSGHSVALFDTAVKLLTECGLSTVAARGVLLPLLKSTLENLSSLTPQSALTGTFARADLATVEMHISAMSHADAADALLVYRSLGLRSLELAAKAGASPTVLAKIELLLRA